MDKHGRKLVPLYKEHDLEEHKETTLDELHDDQVLESRLHKSDHILLKCGLTREDVIRMTRMKR